MSQIYSWKIHTIQFFTVRKNFWTLITCMTGWVTQKSSQFGCCWYVTYSCQKCSMYIYIFTLPSMFINFFQILSSYMSARVPLGIVCILHFSHCSISSKNTRYTLWQWIVVIGFKGLYSTFYQFLLSLLSKHYGCKVSWKMSYCRNWVIMGELHGEQQTDEAELESMWHLQKIVIKRIYWPNWYYVG